MTTTNLLLGLISIILVVGIALTSNNFFKNDQSELAQLQAEINELKNENDRLALTRTYTNTPPPYIPPTGTLPPPNPVVTTPIPKENEDDELRASLKKMLDDSQKRIDELENKNAKLSDENEGLTTENEEMNSARTKRTQRDRMAAIRIKAATNMGEVTTADKEVGFVIFSPSETNKTFFNSGTRLAIRRNLGIIGYIEVDRWNEATNQYSCTIMPQPFADDGYPDIQIGDEVIIDPDE